MSGKQRGVGGVVSAAASARPIYEPGRQARSGLGGWLSDQLIDEELRRVGHGSRSITAVVNRELFDAIVTGVLAGLMIDEVADAMRSGWPELGVREARVSAEGYIERQGELDCACLHGRLASIGE